MTTNQRTMGTNATNRESKMQLSYIIEVNQAPNDGEIFGDMEVVNVTHEFPEDGFSYDDMRAGNCRAFVRVTLQSI